MAIEYRSKKDKKIEARIRSYKIVISHDSLVSLSVGFFLLMCILLNGRVLAQTCKEYINNDTPVDRYIIHSDGTVTDQKTGLMWQQCNFGLSGSDCSQGANIVVNWQGALQAAQQANQDNHLGYSDWRLPNIKELNSLVALHCFDPAINAVVFPNTRSSDYASSSPLIGGNYVRSTNFYIGYNGHGNRTNSYYVRLVR